MPYRKRNIKKRYGRKRRVNSVKKIVNRAIKRNIELKDKTYPYTAVGINPVGGSAESFASTSYGSTATITQLFRGVSRGTNDGERIGHSVNCKGVYMNLAIQNGDSFNQYRLIVFRPKGRYTTTSVAGLVQMILSGTASASTQWAAPVDTDYFKVYYDKILNLRSVDYDGTTSVVQTRFVRKLIKFKSGKKIEWDEQDTQPANDVFVMAISDSAAVANPGVIAGFFKLYYTDA